MSVYTTFDADARIWSGPDSAPLYNPNVSAAAVVLDGLSRRPDHIGQISDTDGSRLSNAELRQMSIRAALQLSRRENIAKGDVVGMVVRNHRLVAPLAVGCIALGAPLNTLAVNFTVEEIVHMFTITSPKIVICDADVHPNVVEALRLIDDTVSVPVYTVDRRLNGIKSAEDLISDEGLNEAQEGAFTPIHLADGSRHPLAIVCTSGTSGPPKGVCISNAQILYQLSQTGICTTDDVNFMFPSLYWITGLLNVLYAMANGGTRVIAASGFDIGLLLRLIPKYNITFTMIPAAAVGVLLQFPDASLVLRQLRILYCGGGGVPLALQQRIDADCLQSPLLMSYGMSEFSGAAARTSPGRGDGLMGSSGRLQPGVRVKLLKCEAARADSELEPEGIDDAALCTVGEEGEICVQVWPPTMGYWTGDRNGANVQPIVDASGWLRTGDVGSFDVDGNLYLVDRLKDMFKYRNMQVTPTELESVVLLHSGGRVAQICVVGVPDEGTGDELAAALVVRRVPNLTEQDVRSIVEERCQEEKWLRGGVWFVDRIPMTATGKVKRREARESVRKAYIEAQLSK